MDNFITLAEYMKITGIVVMFSSLIVGYWIKETSNVKKSLEDHRGCDEKEFYQSQKDNDAAHSEIRQEIGRVKGGYELAVQGLKGDMGVVNGKLDNVLDLLKSLITTKV